MRGWQQVCVVKNAQLEIADMRGWKQDWVVKYAWLEIGDMRDWKTGMGGKICVVGNC